LANLHFDIGHSVFDIRYSNALCLLSFPIRSTLHAILEKQELTADFAENAEK
jgi:hypothetical protein